MPQLYRVGGPGRFRPWYIWVPKYGSVGVLGFVCSMWVSTEMKGMKARASWQPLEVKEYHTGDLLLISHRLYSQPSFGAAWMSLNFKAFMSTSFDQVGVVVMKENIPHIMSIDYDRIVYEPLQQYLEETRPRGVAIRHLEWCKPEIRPTEQIAGMLLAEVRKMPIEPWYGLTAAKRSVAEARHYALAMEKARALTETEKKIRENDVSPAGLAKRRERDRNIELILQGYTKETDFPQFPDFKLHCASFVSSFYAAFDILDRDYPSPTRFCVADFADALPLKHGTVFSAPYIIYKT
jgi:hypothetical protein